MKYLSLYKSIVFFIGIVLYANKPLFAERIIFPEVQYNGNISYEHHIEDSDNNSQHRQLTALNLSANSYIWYPWFMTVNGGLGLAYTQAKTEDNTESTGEIITGNAQMTFLPQSRFPFEAHYNKQDGRTSGDAIDTLLYVNTSYGASQAYRTPDGSVNLLVSYDENRQKTEGESEDISKTTNIIASKTLEKHNFKFDADNDKSERIDDNITIDRNNAILRHSYRPDSSFSMDNMTSFVDTEEINERFINASKQLQVMSNSFWRPKDRPYFVNGGLRFYSIEGENGVVTSESDTLNANAGINYDYSERVKSRANINVNNKKSGGSETTTSNQSVSVSYSPPSIELGSYQYNWNTGAGVTNRIGDQDNGQQINWQIGHGLQRRYITGKYSELSTNYSQSYTVIYDTVTANSQSVNHSASVTWKKNTGRNIMHSRLMASDSRVISGESERFSQLINFQFTSQNNLSRRSSLTGVLTVNSARSQDESADAGGFATTSSANLKYQHKALFNVPRLNFISEIKYDKEIYNPNDDERDDRKTWLNKMNYLIGRLQLQLRAQTSEVGGVTYNVYMFRLRRSFGN